LRGQSAARAALRLNRRLPATRRRCRTAASARWSACSRRRTSRSMSRSRTPRGRCRRGASATPSWPRRRAWTSSRAPKSARPPARREGCIVYIKKLQPLFIFFGSRSPHGSRGGRSWPMSVHALLSKHGVALASACSARASDWRTCRSVRGTCIAGSCGVSSSCVVTLGCPVTCRKLRMASQRIGTVRPCRAPFYPTSCPWTHPRTFRVAVHAAGLLPAPSRGCPRSVGRPCADRALLRFTLQSLQSQFRSYLYDC